MTSKVTTTLVLQEKTWTWSGYDFSVTDAESGVPVVWCKGSNISLRGRKCESWA